MNSENMIFSHQRDIVISLSKYFPEVLVFTLERQVSPGLPKNIEVVPLGWSQGRRLRSTLKAIFNIYYKIPSIQNSLVFSHMTEQISLLVAPITKILGIPHFLWYAHASKSTALKISLKLGVIPLTSTKGSFPKSSKLPICLGQAIDPEMFKYHLHTIPRSRPIRFVYFGRLDPSKQVHELINFIKLASLNAPVALDIFGTATTGHQQYYLSLVEMAKQLPDKNLVTFQGTVPRSQLGQTLMKYDVFIHSFIGSLDKTLLEASCAGLPVLTTNPEYIAEFSWLPWVKSFNYETQLIPEHLNILLNIIRRIDNRLLESKLLEAHEYVTSQHSLESWISKLLNLLQSEPKKYE